jgi:hypothetical protein
VDTALINRINPSESQVPSSYDVEIASWSRVALAVIDRALAKPNG